MTTLDTNQAKPAENEEKQPPAVDALIDGLHRLMRQAAEAKSTEDVKGQDADKQG